MTRMTHSPRKRVIRVIGRVECRISRIKVPFRRSRARASPRPLVPIFAERSRPIPDALRRVPIERRKALLGNLLRKPLPGLVLNATLEQPGDVVFKHACALGCEGIVSKRLGSRYKAPADRAD